MTVPGTGRNDDGRWTLSSATGAAGRATSGGTARIGLGTSWRTTAWRGYGACLPRRPGRERRMRGADPGPADQGTGGVDGPVRRPARNTVAAWREQYHPAGPPPRTAQGHPTADGGNGPQPRGGGKRPLGQSIPTTAGRPTTDGGRTRAERGVGKRPVNKWPLDSNVWAWEGMAPAGRGTPNTAAPTRQSRHPRGWGSH